MKNLLLLAVFPLFIACGNQEEEEKSVPSSNQRTDGNSNPPVSRDVIPGHNTKDTTNLQPIDSVRNNPDEPLKK